MDFMKWSFHIEFEDGSNPYYHFACERELHEKDLNRWRKSYDLELVNTIGQMEFYKAKARNLK